MTQMYSLVKTSSYRDRIYIVKDIILKLVEYGKLNQTALMTFCGLNIKKHRAILERLEYNGLISSTRVAIGKRFITVYQCTPLGYEFCGRILEPYEKMFPRTNKSVPEVDESHQERTSISPVPEPNVIQIVNEKSRHSYL